MNVGIIGAGARATARRQVIEAMPGITLSGVLEALPDLASVAAADLGVEAITALNDLLNEVEVLFVARPTADHFRLAEAATKRGVHVFLEWPPAASLPECRAMTALAEEAGVEVGVSRPLRFHPIFDALPVPWRASLILLRRDLLHTAEPSWPRWLADAVDLCCALAQSHSVQRVDAEAVRSQAAWPEAVAFGLRFHSGTYAQVNFRRRISATGDLYVGGPGFEFEQALWHAPANAPEPDAYDADDALLEAETRAFLDAVTAQRPAPVTILDALHTLRLVERLMQKLR